MRINGYFASQQQAIKNKIESYFHSSARENALTLHRHRAFIHSHLLGGALALALYPLYFYKSESPAYLDLLVLLWFASPFATVYYLFRTGNLAACHMLSSLNLAVFITIGAALSGGINSFLIAWMIIVPLEAALSGKRSVIIAASLISILAVGGLYFATNNGMIVSERIFATDAATMILFGLFSAISYGSAIAMNVQKSHEESEASVRASEKKYRLMADNATDMISVHDENGMVAFASPASATLFNVPATELLGSGLLQNVHISDRPIYMTALSNCRNDNQTVSVEYRMRRRSNSNTQVQDYVWVEMRCQVVSDDIIPGKMKIIAVTRDITSNKNQEITLLKSRDEAESANVAKTRFLANMSHELRTPLNAIIGFSDVLNMELYGKLGNDKYTDYSRLINEAGEHLLSVVNNILDMSKIEVGKFTITPEPFDLGPLLNTCCDMMEPVANENNVNIIKDFDPIAHEIVADSRAVKQMLINLLSNAIKFSGNGMQVIVQLSVNEDVVNIDVIDQGIGISAQDLPRLCNPFVQADNSYKRQHEGVGLGLSVVKGLAQLHGGALKIESKIGIGTTARIELPIEALIDEDAYMEDNSTFFSNNDKAVIPFGSGLKQTKKSAVSG